MRQNLPPSFRKRGGCAVVPWPSPWRCPWPPPRRPPGCRPHGSRCSTPRAPASTPRDTTDTAHQAMLRDDSVEDQIRQKGRSLYEGRKSCTCCLALSAWALALFSSGPGDDDEKRTREARGLGRTNQIAKRQGHELSIEGTYGVLSKAVLTQGGRKRRKGGPP